MAEAEAKGKEADRLAEKARRVEAENMELLRKAEEAELSQKKAEEQARITEEKSLEVEKLNQVRFEEGGFYFQQEEKKAK